MASKWSPMAAMKAYLHTLQLSKEFNNDTDISKLIEPKCMEYISALAAGNQAQVIVDVEFGGISKYTLALAVASKCTGGQLICIRCDEQSISVIKSYLQSLDLEDLIVDFKVGRPLDVIKQYKKIDFALIDKRLENFMEILLGVDMNPNGSVMVVSNLWHDRRGTACSQVMKGIRGEMKSIVLPIGEGIEVTRIENFNIPKCRKIIDHNVACNYRPRRRFLVQEL